MNTNSIHSRKFIFSDQMSKENTKKIIVFFLTILFIILLIYIVSIKINSEYFEPPLSSEMNKIYSKGTLCTEQTPQQLRSQELRSKQLRSQELRSQELRSQELRSQELRSEGIRGKLDSKVQQKGIECESCANTINIMKNYNNNNTAIQILQDSNNFQDALKCYKEVASNLKLPQNQCYSNCMSGNFGLPSADVLCNSACSTDNCIDSYFSGIAIIKK